MMGALFFVFIIAVCYALIVDASRASLANYVDRWSEMRAGGPRLVTAPRDTGLVVEVGPASILLDSNAQLLINDDIDSGRHEVTLQRGRLTAHVRPMGSNEYFGVRTFNAVAGVRGTIFSVAILQDIRTMIEVQQGSVFAEGISGERMIIEAGQKAAIEGMASPEKVEAAPKPPDIGKMMEEMQAMPAPPPKQDEAKVSTATQAHPSDNTRSIDYNALGYDPNSSGPNGRDRIDWNTKDVPVKNIERTNVEPVDYSANP